MIKLNITKLVENPNYEEACNLGSGAYQRAMDERKFNEVDTLNVEITEEQFEAIRKSVIENF